MFQNFNSLLATAGFNDFLLILALVLRISKSIILNATFQLKLRKNVSTINSLRMAFLGFV